MKLIISMSAAGDSLDSQLADLFSQYKQAYADSDTDKVRTIMRQVQAFGKKLVPYIEKAAKHPCAVSPNSELINGYTVKSLDRAFEYRVTDKSTRFRLYVYIRFQRKPTYQCVVTSWVTAGKRGSFVLSANSKPITAALKHLKEEAPSLFDGTVEELRKKAILKYKKKAVLKKKTLG